MDLPLLLIQWSEKIGYSLSRLWQKKLDDIVGFMRVFELVVGGNK